MKPIPMKPNFNLSPTQTSPIVRNEDGKLQLSLLHWGLIPVWAKDKKIAQINARSETASEKPMFRSAFKSRRCIVPLSGFIEWKRVGETKRPFAISLKEDPIMSVAGLWETWKFDSQDVLTFCVLTTSANSFMEKIHDRMPVILDRKGEEAWLDPDQKDVEKLQKLMKPCPSKWLHAFEVSPLINSPKNNSKEVLKPLTGEIIEG